jgi:hypothetical protein
MPARTRGRHRRICRVGNPPTTGGSMPVTTGVAPVSTVTADERSDMRPIAPAGRSFDSGDGLSSSASSASSAPGIGASNAFR